MSQTDDIRNEVASFSKQLVSCLAPEESEFFEEIENQFYLNRQPDKQVAVEEDPLQFGLHDTARLLTPAAIAATTVVFHYLLEILSEITKKVAIGVLKEKVTAALHGDSSQLLVKPDQLAEIRSMARDEALRYGVTSSTATAMAEEIVRSLHL
jgi:hypothetical protein